MNGGQKKYLVMLFVLLLFLAGCDRDPGKETPPPAKEQVMSEHIAPEIRRKMPDFVLPMVQDGTSFSSDSLHGRVVLVSFFKLWCRTCVADLTMQQKLQDEYDDDSFLVIGMAVVEDHTDEELELFVEKLGLEYPILVSNEKLREGFGGIAVVPTAFLVDQQGNIVKKYVSHLEQEHLSAEIAALLK
jgi:cytochrome c biogenesis protein CcmG/thiol:disulfide interchange protein DsbE